MTTIPVYFTPRMVAPDQGVSPSAHKPRLVVDNWIRKGFAVDIREPAPVKRDQLTLAHSQAYIDDVLCLRRANGFGNFSAKVARTLQYTSGAMLGAARAALANRKAAVAPVSGFHHAGWGAAHGFCTFNGLMVTAVVLRQEQPDFKVGILDFDQHYGDGTNDIIRALDLSWVVHFSAGAKWDQAWQARSFLDAIPSMVEKMRDCDVILYQAGADPHIDDPLGGWLTTEQLAQRDRLVFETAACLGVPVAWNLAGGYQRTASGGIEPVLEIHRNTLAACCGVYCLGEHLYVGVDPARHAHDAASLPVEDRRAPIGL